ncbi:MAG: endonuclease domain-containing protein [Chloroflexota bacterium]
MRTRKDTTLPTQGIITGQKINPAKLQRAKTMRRNMTPAEKRLWSALRRNQLDGLHFRRQQIIDGFIVDLYCQAAGLVVEVDGPVHDQQVEYDITRDRALAARGLHILRVKNEEVMQNMERVLDQIRIACRARVDPLPGPPPIRRRESNSPSLAGEGPGERSPSPRLAGEGPAERSP